MKCAIRVFRCLLTLFLVLQAGQSVMAADAETSKEDQVKAAYIYNFIQFTEWPAGAIPNDSSPLVVTGVCGDSLAKAMDNALSGKTMGSHPIVFKRITTDKIDQTSCQVLIICGDDLKAIDLAISQARRKSILTVGDQAEFCSVGGIIRFFKEDNFIRFEINVKEAEKINLRISSKLLKLAKIFSK